MIELPVRKVQMSVGLDRRLNLRVLWRRKHKILSSNH